MGQQISGDLMPAAANRTSHNNVERKLEQGLRFHKKGNIDKARQSFVEALTLNPRHAGAMRLIALLAHETGATSHAIEFLKRAISADPAFALAHRNLAHILAETGDNIGALHHYKEAARLDPKDVNARIDQARIESDVLGRYEEALATYEAALEIAPDEPKLHRGRGKMLAELGHPDEAAEALAEAVRLAPDDAITVLHQATFLSQIQRDQEAAIAFKRATELAPEDPEIWLGYGNVMNRLGETQIAVDMLSRVIELKPDSAPAYTNLGNILSDQAMLDDAIACHRMSIHHNPSLYQSHNNLGSALQNACRPAEAAEAFQQALALNPGQDGTMWNLALCLLAIGRIEEGWDIYGFGFASGSRKPYRPFPGLLWEGESLADKTIMLWKEQGVGDDLRFSTCFHDIIAEAGHVIIETDKRLVPLYQRTWPQATVRAETHGSTGFENYTQEIDFDVTAPAGIAASMRRRQLTDFPREARPLIACPDKRAQARKWLDSLGDGPKIGLTWRSGIRNPLRDIFATELSAWKALLEIDGASLISLQYGKPDEEIADAFEKHGLKLHQMPGLDTHDDLDGVAALTAELDLTCGLWNAATEMSGALAIPTIAYMPAHHPMQLGTGVMPWHPSYRLISALPGFDQDALARTVMLEAKSLLASRK